MIMMIIKMIIIILMFLTTQVFLNAMEALSEDDRQLPQVRNKTNNIK